MRTHNPVDGGGSERARAFGSEDQVERRAIDDFTDLQDRIWVVSREQGVHYPHKVRRGYRIFGKEQAGANASLRTNSSIRSFRACAFAFGRAVGAVVELVLLRLSP
jgi:hypothetical protein